MIKPVHFVLFLAALQDSPAIAQMAGHYQGTNKDGGTVDVYVGASDGGFVVTQADDADTVTCKGTNGGYYTGYYFGNQPITDGQATLSALSTGIYYGSSLTFSGTKVSGTVQFEIPEFIGPTEPPRTACASKTPNAHFTATYAGPETRAASPAWTMAQPLPR